MNNRLPFGCPLWQPFKEYALLLLLGWILSACQTQSTSLMTEDKIMHVTIQRTGGFAGIPINRSIDASNLSVAETDHLERMIESAHFFELPESVTANPQPDRFEYQVTVERNGQKHSVTAAEHVMPAGLKELIDWMMKTGQPTK